MSDVDVAANLKAVTDEIAAAGEKADRASDAVTLVAVSKTHDADHIRPALDANVIL